MLWLCIAILVLLIVGGCWYWRANDLGIDDFYDGMRAQHGIVEPDEPVAPLNCHIRRDKDSR